MNNLHGCATRQYLPVSNFKWVKNIDKTEQKLMRIKNNSLNRYALEADLEYSEKLYDIYNHYPSAPQKINMPK